MPDPGGFCGIGIYKVDDEAEMRRLLEPANGLLHYEVTPMADAVVGSEVIQRNAS
jgi:hypothetical protein